MMYSSFFMLNFAQEICHQPTIRLRQLCYWVETNPTSAPILAVCKKVAFRCGTCTAPPAPSPTQDS